MAQPVLELKQLQTYFFSAQGTRIVKAVDGVSFTLNEGEILGQGENLLTKSEGEMRQLRGSQLTMILQDPMMSLNPLFTIGEQIAEPLRVHRRMGGSRLLERIKDLLRGVRIPSPEVRLREYPHQMSGGMGQLIVGAIGISCEPRLLIADEPTTSLDVTIQAQYLNLLKDIQQRSRLA